MPGRDRTGPAGMGPMSGRGAGFCAGTGRTRYEMTANGRGYGMGCGRGWRNRFYATGMPGWMRFGAMAAEAPIPNPVMEKQSLKHQADALQAQLDAIQKRLAEIDKDTTTA